tara:strand:- start:65 stop:361 length:297 start_codon:yes stop_codon:yes gene_type:complete
VRAAIRKEQLVLADAERRHPANARKRETLWMTSPLRLSTSSRWPACGLLRGTARPPWSTTPQPSYFICSSTGLEQQFRLVMAVTCTVTAVTTWGSAVI